MESVELDPAREIDDSASSSTARLSPGSRNPGVYALHKPAGVVSTVHDTHGRPTVVDLVNDARRLYPVGRLDADSTGLILLTNDGELANLLAHPRHEVPKTYRARLGGPRVAAGRSQGSARAWCSTTGRTAPAQVRLVSRNLIELELREGRNARFVACARRSAIPCSS